MVAPSEANRSVVTVWHFHKLTAGITRFINIVIGDTSDCEIGFHRKNTENYHGPFRTSTILISCNFSLKFKLLKSLFCYFVKDKTWISTTLLIRICASFISETTNWLSINRWKLLAWNFTHERKSKPCISPAMCSIYWEKRYVKLKKQKKKERHKKAGLHINWTCKCFKSWLDD